MNEMPDLPIEQKLAEQKKSIRYWIDRCHHLEKMYSEQKRILGEASEQIRLLQADRIIGKAPMNTYCSCCESEAMHIAKCGHYFCQLCYIRNHHIDCISCLGHV